MKHWTIQKLVGAGFALLIAIIASLCAYSIIRLAEIKDKAGELRDDDIAHLQIISEIQTKAQENATHISRLFVSGSQENTRDIIAAINANSAANDKLLKSFEAMITADKDREKEDFGGLLAKREAYAKYRDRIFELKLAGDNEAALSLFQDSLSPALVAYIDSLKAMGEYNRTQANEALAEILEDTASTRLAAIWATTVSLLAAISISVVIVRQLSATLKKLMMALIQVNSSTTEMTATLKEQQVSANEVASTSVEIGATAKEISATTSELGRTMSDVAAVAEQTAQIATGGQAGLSRLEGTMRQIMGATNIISAKLAILNEKTANINSMVTTINKVADQTNLLSLNAAIEAEKAGEFGQGFAVVATEIRRLADQTAVATYDIEQMVKEMQSAVSAGVMGMDKFAEEVRRGNEEVCGVTAQLVQIIQQVQALTPRFETVNDGMQTQSAAAGQISEALTQLGETAQQSAQALLQNTEAVEQLTEASHSLQSAVEKFKSKDSNPPRS